MNDEYEKNDFVAIIFSNRYCMLVYDKTRE